MKEIPKAYEPKNYEDSIYKHWEESGFFNPDNLSGEPYAILFPPPNVTGVLHLGHALENSLMDSMIRYQRMKGKKTLLLPGTDHAAVATQAKVEKELVKQGVKNPREEFGREGLLKRIREYAESSKSTILSQIKKMGTSCDWSRLAYTFDEQRSKAVNEVFIKMYNDGLIYRGYRVVNWTVKGQSTCSDDELVYIERPAKLYTFKYSKDFPFLIATTRPETKLGDTAVAVNPKDERYNKYLGQIFIVDVGAAQPLKIKIIADENVDINFGTGALGVTPAHSAVDFSMYEKQKAIGDQIDIIPVIGVDGKMLPAAGKDYVGLNVEQAREKFVNWLKDHDLLEKEEDITQSVGTSDRFGDVVEALPMTQWFVDVNKKISSKDKSLKELMIEAVSLGHNGDPRQKVTITPDRFEKIYYKWIENLRDWCISRQIWWGHRIPVWYRGEEVLASVEKPTGDDWVQDQDTLDTWFSSGLWTFSTLGWPEKTNDLKNFHPINWMQMGHEILFFWMARMILMTAYTIDQIPFKDVYIHGILRDEHGKKFSKSADNGVDPLEMIEKYGCDALRLCLLSGITPGNDSRFYTEKIEGARNFVNKFWNISRFILQSVEQVKLVDREPEPKTFSDQWILLELRLVIALVNQSVKAYQFSYAIEKLQDFTKDLLADWYLEIVKIEGKKDEVLLYILQNILKLWHPFIPFVTEAIWSNFEVGSLLMIEKYPESNSIYGKDNIKINNEVELFKGIIKSLRNLRSENKIEPARLVNAVIVAGDNYNFIKEQENVIKKLTRCEKIDVTRDGVKQDGSVGDVVGGVEVYLSLVGLIDVEKEKARIKKELEQVKKYADGLDKKLSNQEFIKNAPPAVIEKEQAKLAEAKEKLEKLNKQLQKIV